MAAPNQFNETENAAHVSGAPVDPFAVDFFGGSKPLAEDDEPAVKNERRIGRRAAARKKSDWYKKLPRLTNREAEFSNLLSNLPENLTETAARTIGDTLARYAFKSPDEVDCSVISVREVGLRQEIQRLSAGSNIFLIVGGRGSDAPAVIVFDAEFAVRFIDFVLDGSGAQRFERRDLSPIETTIVEFLAANVLSEINGFLGGSVLFLQDAGTLPTGNFYESPERGAQLLFSLKVGELDGVVSLLAPQKFWQNLDQSRNPLFGKRHERKKLSDYERFVPTVDLRLQIGATSLDADSLLYREPNDIVLIDQPQIDLHGDNFAGILQFRVGRAGNFRLRGAAETIDLQGSLNFKVEEITSEEARRRFTPAKFKMEEKENDLTPEDAFDENAGETDAEAADEEIAPSLENVQVALRVEIAGNKISLRELQNMRVGQIIALGTSPNDPVRIVTDNNEEPVATGELIEIEGQLGVRLTKVFI